MELTDKPAKLDETEEPPGRTQPLPRSRRISAVAEPLLPFYPTYFETALTQPQQRLYQRNGYGHLLKSLQVQVITDINLCRQLWQEFTPKKSVFDTWEFRLAFWKGYQKQRQAYFLLLKTGPEVVALLPLWHETDQHRYTWFGSTWQEDNTFFVKDLFLVPLLLAAAPQPLHLNAIIPQAIPRLMKTLRFEADDPKYILHLNLIHSAEDFLATLKKKRRYNLRRDRKIIAAQQPKIILNRFADFNTLVHLSQVRFCQKGEDTDWDDPRRVETFRQVIELGRKKASYQTRMITIQIGSKIAAVDLILLFNDCYYPVKCGYDVANFPGIGNFVNLLEIDDATQLGMKKMDFLEINYGWKDKWFETASLLKYEKPLATT